jgi:hypothetical protein
MFDLRCGHEIHWCSGKNLDSRPYSEAAFVAFLPRAFFSRTGCGFPLLAIARAETRARAACNENQYRKIQSINPESGKDDEKEICQHQRVGQTPPVGATPDSDMMHSTFTFDLCEHVGLSCNVSTPSFH